MRAPASLTPRATRAATPPPPQRPPLFLFPPTSPPPEQTAGSPCRCEDGDCGAMAADLAPRVPCLAWPPHLEPDPVAHVLRGLWPTPASELPLFVGRGAAWRWPLPVAQVGAVGGRSGLALGRQSDPEVRWLDLPSLWPMPVVERRRASSPWWCGSDERRR
jgi:hypothetical protein